jgi:hypothetical protein
MLSAAAVALLVAASAASAQDCTNGYRDTGNGVTLKCDAISDTLAADAAISADDEGAAADASAEALPEEPLFTGTIFAGGETENGDSLEADVMAEDQGPECTNGYREFGNGVIALCESGAVETAAAASAEPLGDAVALPAAAEEQSSEMPGGAAY